MYLIHIPEECLKPLKPEKNLKRRNNNRYNERKIFLNERHQNIHIQKYIMAGKNDEKSDLCFNTHTHTCAMIISFQLWIRKYSDSKNIWEKIRGSKIILVLHFLQFKLSRGNRTLQLQGCEWKFVPQNIYTQTL